MKVGFIVNEFFKYGSYGGYGFATKAIAKGLVKRGVETELLINNSRFKKIPKLFEVEEGVVIRGYPASKRNLLFPIKEFKTAAADIYQTCNISLDTNYAMRCMPCRKHIINFQDPRSQEDWREIYTHPQALIEDGGTKSSFNYTLKLKIAFSLYRNAIEKADGLTIQAKYLAEKVNDIFRVKQNYEFLPNPVNVPKHKLTKANKPTVTFLGRLDSIKRPEVFFELAKRFPDADFLVVGKATNDKKDEELRKTYQNQKNLKFLGLILDEKLKSEILGKSWILINTSLHECLPVSFLEAWAHKCAVLSCQNPDDLTEKYGYFTGKILGTGLKAEDLKKFEEGFRWLIENNNWEQLGEKGYQYVLENHEFDEVIGKHIKYYRKTLGK